MKVKANDKFNNVSPQAIPCSVSERKSLAKGEAVDINKELADKLLAMNIVEKLNKKQSKVKEKK